MINTTGEDLKMLKGLNKKIVKVIKMGMLLIVICVNCVIIINKNDGRIYTKDTTAAEFRLEDNIINATILN